MKKTGDFAIVRVNEKRSYAVRDQRKPTTLLSFPDGRRQAGFTIIELLVAIAVTMIVAVGLFSIYDTFFKQTHVQDMVLEAQQNARAAINLLEREVVNAGYGGGTADIFTVANLDEIEFRYTDPATDTELSPTAGQLLLVKYSLNTVSGVDYLVRRVNNETTSTVATEKVIPHVQNFAMTYFDISGATIADTSTQANRDTIRFASITLVTETADVLPGTTTKKTFMLRTHLRIRNVGIGETSMDTTAPSAPLDFIVRDPGLCGRLKVKWTESPEGDVAGYDLFYGTASGDYIGVINIPVAVLSGSTYSCSKVSGSIECTINPSSPALAFTPSDLSSTTTYFLAVQARDTSLHHSSFSTEVSNNPDPSNADFGTVGDDSNINPVKPASLTGFTGADGAGEGEVYLSWDAYDTASNPDVVGFRVYRSYQPFPDYPVDPAIPDIEWIAGEPLSGRPKILSESATFLTDDSADILGCKVYYYAIAPVNCDGSLVTDDPLDDDTMRYISSDYAVAYGDGSDPGADSPDAGVTDTAPGETTSTSAPVIDARAGWKRVAVSLTQPADPDLAQTCLYTNDGSTYPELLATKDAVGCLDIDTIVTPDAILIPDSGGVFTVAELAPSASIAFWHDSMTLEFPPVPSLAEVGTYSYRALSFDLCGNPSGITGAQAITVLCGEDPPSGEKPPAVSDLQASCCDTPVTLTWTAVSSNLGIPSSPTNPYDLAGYRIFRSTIPDINASTMISGPAPFWGTSFNDTSISDGGTYYYWVATTDCPYEKGDDTGATPPTEAQIRAHMSGGFLNSVMVGPVYPGIIDRDEKCPGAGGCTKDNHREVLTGVNIVNDSGNGDGSSTPSSDFTHDTVTLFFDNTSTGDMTVQSA
ncbi:MAG: hypothetical protein GQ522_05310, partial [Deltaproteobacteria bacterium]|nr:hypothetical protein [Deltaproteobacteria bacterium]